MSGRTQSGRSAAAAVGKASDQLARILYILPLAARPGGASLDELARALDVPAAVILTDLEHVTAREYYMPAGTADTYRIALSGSRVMFDPGTQKEQHFTRPVRLNGREALALGLGLRILASETSADQGDALLDLARRLETQLVAPDPTVQPEAHVRTSNRPAASLSEPSRAYDADAVEYDPVAERELFLDLGEDAARGILAEAIVRRRRCTIEYLKPGGHAPATRRIEPYTLVYGDGNWYVVARDTDLDARRVFRLDRVLRAQEEEGGFEPAADFDASAFLAAGRGPFLAEGAVTVAVRYSPAIAPWIIERTGAQPDDDGSVLLRHEVADARWLARHVLQYGGDATIEGGPEVDAYRRLVAESAARLAG